MKKNVRFIVSLILLSGSLLLFNCQGNFLDEGIAKENLQEKVALSKGKKKIKYRGHSVNHRFKSSEKELKEKHTKKYLKKLYNKLRKNMLKELLVEKTDKSYLVSKLFLKPQKLSLINSHTQS